jgi:hypothetical protein
VPLSTASQRPQSDYKNESNRIAASHQMSAPPQLLVAAVIRSMDALVESSLMYVLWLAVFVLCYVFGMDEPTSVQSRTKIVSESEATEKIHKIFVMTPIGTGVVCKVDLSGTTVREVKEKIQEVRQIPIVNQRLMHGEKWLKDDHRTLSYYKTQDGANLHVVLLPGRK